MWKVLRYAENDIKDEEGYVIYPAGEWYKIGSYWTLDECASIVKHEIYLYNCTCQDGDANPKFRIESDFE